MPTGRDIISIKDEINKYNIPYDYIICSDGSIIYDKEKMVKMYKIKDKFHKIIFDFIKNITYDELQIAYEKGYSDEFTNEPFASINISIKDNKEFNFDKLKEKYQDFNYLIYTHPPVTYYCIKPKSVDKAYAINYFKNKFNLKMKDIYVIGDSDNDLEMIKKYHGVCVSSANENVIKISKKVYKEVFNYLEDIKNGNI